MPKAESLWQWVESRTGRTAVMAEWRSHADGNLVAFQGMLTPLERVARTYPNPRAGRPLKVIRHADQNIVAIGDSDWRNRLALEANDIILYQLDLRLLRSAICNALDGVNIAKTPVEQATRCLQIGNWEPKKAASFPVFLLLCPNRKALREQVLELQHRSHRPGAILFTPSRMNWTDTTESAAQTGNMLLVPLSEVVSLEDDGLVETESWEEYLQAFAQMVKLTLPSNYRNKKPQARRASLTAMVEKTKKALVEHVYSARDGVVANIDAGKGARVVKFLTKTELGRLAGLQPYQVTRCFKADPQVKRLYEIANDPEQLLRYGK